MIEYIYVGCVIALSKRLKLNGLNAMIKYVECGITVTKLENMCSRVGETGSCQRVKGT